MSNKDRFISRCLTNLNLWSLFILAENRIICQIKFNRKNEEKVILC